jgi:ATP dependent DNA ligase-like protein
MKRCQWLKPVLIAQVKFTEWTHDGQLRQPVFLGREPNYFLTKPFCAWVQLISSDLFANDILGLFVTIIRRL